MSRGCKPNAEDGNREAHDAKKKSRSITPGHVVNIASDPRTDGSTDTQSGEQHTGDHAELPAVEDIGRRR